MTCRNREFTLRWLGDRLSCYGVDVDATVRDELTQALDALDVLVDASAEYRTLGNLARAVKMARVRAVLEGLAESGLELPAPRRSTGVDVLDLSSGTWGFFWQGRCFYVLGEGPVDTGAPPSGVFVEVPEGLVAQAYAAIAREPSRDGVGVPTVHDPSADELAARMVTLGAAPTEPPMPMNDAEVLRALSDAESAYGTDGIAWETIVGRLVAAIPHGTVADPRSAMLRCVTEYRRGERENDPTRRDRAAAQALALTSGDDILGGTGS